MAALRRLRESDLVICPADKGASIVVMPKSKYIQFCHTHLADCLTYETVKAIPSIQPMFLEAAADLLKILPARVRRRLQALGTRMPNFYGLPKLHKNPVVIRPIVSLVA